MKEHPLYGFNSMEQELYLACLSTRRFDFNLSNSSDERKIGKLYSSFCQILEGTVSFDFGSKVIQGKAGDLFYMPEGARYISHWKGDPHISFIATYFRFFVTNDMEEYFSRQKHSVPFDRQFAFQKIDALCDFQALSEIESILHDYYQNKQGQLMAFSRLYRLMALAYPHLKRQEANIIYSVILPAVIYIERFYMRNEPVSTYARICNLSESRFYHLFQASMQTSPIDFRNQVRIHHAAFMLEETQESIEEIAIYLGFSSPEYFRRMFRQIYDMSPSLYRKQLFRSSQVDEIILPDKRLLRTNAI